jgi:glycosyltransferase involved in cell wall biosynthesis
MSMRITFLAPAVELSGGVKVMAIYAKELAKLGHKVTVVSLPQAHIPLGDKFRSLFRGDGWKTQAPLLPIEVAEHIVLDRQRRIEDGDVPDADVVIATWWETAEWATELSEVKGRKYHFIQHHEVFPHLPSRAKDVYRLPFKKIVVAKWLKDLMATEYGDKDALVVPNTIDRLEYYSPKRPKNKRLSVGLLYNPTEFKGLDIALEAIRLARMRAKFKVVSFGAAPIKSSLPLPRGSRFFLRPSADKIRQIYRSCDVWLTCSRSEGFNLPALEAMACRTPVVSTYAGWPAEGIVNGVNGYLCEIDQTPDIADAILRILSLDGADWRLMSEAAYRTMTTASWEESAKLFEKAISLR